MQGQLICGLISSISGPSKDQGYRQTRQPRPVSVLRERDGQVLNVGGYGANDCSGSRVMKIGQRGQLFFLPRKKRLGTRLGER